MRNVGSAFKLIGSGSGVNGSGGKVSAPKPRSSSAPVQGADSDDDELVSFLGGAGPASQGSAVPISNASSRDAGEQKAVATPLVQPQPQRAIPVNTEAGVKSRFIATARRRKKQTPVASHSAQGFGQASGTAQPSTRSAKRSRPSEVIPVDTQAPATTKPAAKPETRSAKRGYSVAVVGQAPSVPSAASQTPPVTPVPSVQHHQQQQPFAATQAVQAAASPLGFVPTMAPTQGAGAQASAQHTPPPTPLVYLPQQQHHHHQPRFAPIPAASPLGVGASAQAVQAIGRRSSLRSPATPVNFFAAVPRGEDVNMAVSGGAGSDRSMDTWRTGFEDLRNETRGMSPEKRQEMAIAKGAKN